MIRLKNPFPGLAPYALGQSGLYACPPWQKSRFLGFCNDRNFVALQGSTGSGKTSFVRGEVFPELLAGHTSRGKSRWLIAEMVPGKHPLVALAVAFARLFTDKLGEKEKSDPNLVQEFEGMLRSSKYGVIEIVERYRLVEDANILLFIDQLEELGPSTAAGNSEAVLFVDRLLEAIHQSAYPITILAAVQSERISEFVRFPRLMQDLKENSYSIQPPGREDLSALFQKVVRSGTVRFEEGFFKTLSDHYRDREFNPGKFQHALSRCVDEWNRAKVRQLVRHAEQSFREDAGLGEWVSRSEWMKNLMQEPLTTTELRAYEERSFLLLDERLPGLDGFTSTQRQQWEEEFHELVRRTEPQEISWKMLGAVGGPDASIEQQLEEVYRSLTPADQETCRLMFQSLSGMNPYGAYGIPRTVAEMVEITRQPEESLIRVLRRFTNDRCAAVRVIPSVDVQSRLDKLEIILDPDYGKVSTYSEVTVAQPVILQAWSRLRNWIDQEHQDSITYLDIVKDVASQEPFYEGIKLTTVWAWYESCKPHSGWAARYPSEYDTSFEVVKNFILKSKSIADRNQEILLDEQRAQAARSARMRRFLVGGFIVAVLTGLIVLYLTEQAVEAQSAARSAREQAQLETSKAAQEKSKADSSRIMAEKAIADSRMSRLVARQEQDSARKSKAEAERQNVIAQQALREQREMNRRNEQLRKELSESARFIQSSNLELDFLQRLARVNTLSENARRRVESQLDPETRIAANVADIAYATLRELENDPRFDSAMTLGRNPQGLRRAYQSAGKRLISTLATINQNLESPSRYLFDNIRYGTAMDIFPGNTAKRLVIGTDQNKLWRLDFPSMNDLDVFKFTITEDFKLPGGLVSGIRTVRYDQSGKNFYVGTVDGLVRFNKASRTLRRGSENVVAIFPVADEEFITVDRSGTVEYFREYKAVDSVVMQYRLQAVDFSPAGRFLIGNGKDNGLIRINLQPVESKSRFMLEELDVRLPEGSRVWSMKILPQRNWLALGMQSGELLLLDLATNKVIFRDVSRHLSTITCMELDERNQVLITGGLDKAINVWDLQDFVLPGGRIAASVEPITFRELQPIMDIQVSPGGWFFALSRGQADEKINRTAAGRLSIWSTDLGQLKKRLNDLRKQWVIPNFSLEGITTEP